ncbi:hypothetical protein ACMFMG_009585 [Clarireedia jacksonii]
MTPSPVNEFSPWNVTVREICQTLGWDGDLGTPRHFKMLSLQVSKFRKRAIGDDEFSIDVNDSKVRRCASEFCDRDLKRQELFVSSESSDYPSLPEDREKIEEGIAKILCLQEYYRRRNEDTKSKKAAQKGENKGPASDDEDNDGDGNFNFGGSGDDVGATESDDDDDDEFVPRARQDTENESTITVTARTRSVTDRLATTRTKMERKTQNEEAIRYNIYQHLNYVYSLATSPSPVYRAALDEKKEFSITDPGVRWLFETSTAANWAEETKILAWRFMHGNDLYSLNPGFGELTKIGVLVELLMKHLHIKVDSTHHAVIFEKTKKFVVYSTRKFIRDYGLLQRFENDTICRRPNFDSELQIQKETWERIHKLSSLASPDSRFLGGEVLTFVQLNSQSSQSKRDTTDTNPPAPSSTHKRTNSTNITAPAPLSVSSDKHSKIGSKRQRTITDAESEAPDSDAESARPADVQSSLNSEEPAHHGSSRELEFSYLEQDALRNPPRHSHTEAMPSGHAASRLLPGFRPQGRHTSSNTMDDRTHRRDQNYSTNRSSSPSIHRSSPRGRSPYRVHRLPHMHSSPNQYSRQSSTSSFGRQHQLSRETSSSSIGISEPLNEMNISSIYSNLLDHSSVTTNSVTTNSEAPSIPDPSEPEDIILILHNKSGTLDFETPVPFHVFRNTTISAFFTLYSQRSGVKLEWLEKLTFTVVFANHLTFTMSRDEDEKGWRRLKKRIGSLFLMIKERKPNETDFEVWVDAGEVGTVG